MIDAEGLFFRVSSVDGLDTQSHAGGEDRYGEEECCHGSRLQEAHGRRRKEKSLAPAAGGTIATKIFRHALLSYQCFIVHATLASVVEVAVQSIARKVDRTAANKASRRGADRP